MDREEIIPLSYSLPSSARGPPLFDIIYSRSRLPKLRGNPYREAFEDLLVRDGPLCDDCKSREADSIDHIIPIRNGGTHCLSNMRLLCFKCNARKGGYARQNPLPSTPEQVSERDSKVGTEQLHRTVDYQQGSAEMKTNDLWEIDARAWLRAFVKAHGSIQFSIAIEDVAEKQGVNLQTAIRGIRKMCSEHFGELKAIREPNYPKRKFIIAKEPDIEAFKISIEAHIVNTVEVQIFKELTGMQF